METFIYVDILHKYNGKLFGEERERRGQVGKEVSERERELRILIGTKKLSSSYIYICRYKYTFTIRHMETELIFHVCV